MKFGGKVAVEVEGDEAINVGGQGAMVEGPDHEEGGVDLDLPQGALVFSKRLKLGDKTMAEREMASASTIIVGTDTIELLGGPHIRLETEDSGLYISEQGVRVSNGFIPPVGTTAQRPSSPEPGMIRFNTTTSKHEGWDGSAWNNFY